MAGSILVLAQFFVQYALATVLGVGVDEGIATQFGEPGDPFAGGNLACEHRPIPQDEAICAHRWLPCGTKVVITNLERSGEATCRIADRGPYGIETATSRWKGLIDLTPPVARAVKLDGRDVVRLLYKLPPPGHAAYRDPTYLAPPPRRRGSLAAL